MSEAVAIARDPADCGGCGETTREYSLCSNWLSEELLEVAPPWYENDPDAPDVEPICLDCRAADALPEGMPRGGRRVCDDCLRGERDGVKALIRRTWGIYPQDRYRDSSFPRYCDDCWGWRQVLAPLKPEQHEIEKRWRQVMTDDE